MSAGGLHLWCQLPDNRLQAGASLEQELALARLLCDQSEVGGSSGQHFQQMTQDLPEPYTFMNLLTQMVTVICGLRCRCLYHLFDMRIHGQL
jgi:hypothetical protein